MNAKLLTKDKTIKYCEEIYIFDVTHFFVWLRRNMYTKGKIENKRDWHNPVLVYDFAILSDCWRSIRLCTLFSPFGTPTKGGLRIRMVVALQNFETLLPIPEGNFLSNKKCDFFLSKLTRQSPQGGRSVFGGTFILLHLSWWSFVYVCKMCVDIHFGHVFLCIVSCPSIFYS